jgi:hypothetical protein
MKITKRVREQAALLCQVAASNGISTWEADQALDGCRESFTVGTAAGQLARKAIRATTTVTIGNAMYAEAESMLRTGWRP